MTRKKEIFEFTHIEENPLSICEFVARGRYGCVLKVKYKEREFYGKFSILFFKGEKKSANFDLKFPILKYIEDKKLTEMIKLSECLNILKSGRIRFQIPSFDKRFFQRYLFICSELREANINVTWENVNGYELIPFEIDRITFVRSIIANLSFFEIHHIPVETSELEIFILDLLFSTLKPSSSREMNIKYEKLYRDPSHRFNRYLLSLCPSSLELSDIPLLTSIYDWGNKNECGVELYDIFHEKGNRTIIQLMKPYHSNLSYYIFTKFDDLMNSDSMEIIHILYVLVNKLYLFYQQYIYGDFKPNNVLVSVGSERKNNNFIKDLRLCDFETVLWAEKARLIRKGEIPPQQNGEKFLCPADEVLIEKDLKGIQMFLGKMFMKLLNEHEMERFKKVLRFEDEDYTQERICRYLKRIGEFLEREFPFIQYKKPIRNHLSRLSLSLKLEKEKNQKLGTEMSQKLNMIENLVQNEMKTKTLQNERSFRFKVDSKI